MICMHSKFKVQTCRLVSDELAGLDFADAREQRPYVVLRHSLRQVVDDQVRLAICRQLLLSAGRIDLLVVKVVFRHSGHLDKLRKDQKCVAW